MKSEIKSHIEFRIQNLQKQISRNNKKIDTHQKEKKPREIIKDLRIQNQEWKARISAYNNVLYLLEKY